MALLAPGSLGVRRRFFLLLWLLAGTSRLAAQVAAPAEYQVKAVFLFNFAQFIEWPSAAFASPGTPLVIGVLGENPFGNYLDETVRGETVDGRALLVEQYQRVEDIGHCHILFVSQSEAARIEAIAAALRGRPILTVSDAPGSAVRGVMIRFVTEKNRIRLRINLNAAKSAGLTISSKLLRPAEIVTTQGN